MNQILASISEIAQAENITITHMETVIGASKGVLSRAIKKDTDIQAKWLGKLVENFPRYNASWILTGKGNKFLNSYSSEPQIVEEPRSEYTLRTDTSLENQSIPLYNIEAAASLVELFRSHNNEDAIDTISIPNLPKCDGAVYVSGDSMYPLLKSGDIVMYKEIHNILDGLFWGEMYLVSVEFDDEEYVAVKFIQKSDKGDKWIKLVSQNEHHQSRDVELSKVRALALVKASIRINSMN